MPDGSVKTLSQKDGDRFYASVVALGLCGIVTEVELAVQPTYQIATVVYQSFSRDTLRDSFDSVFDSAYRYMG